ncbi:bifunctional ADP-dependent NAD(P)H-hydrate dehydratase/NAD(P)H-hydrate epimerase [Nitratireductor soli]|uniref:bifunctional ADP-dependent NAD(P)H-hydrate dehydratase/NAD(P)H-hydrate epimerase n=1 Tax=Nitratireductor soli TaxID=1670619 RepID=UPI00065E656E|nr:bifunctional ADP-dependent NAD(P)H-hydrate dehydratase/NAD(P)H-hydrate epimerase [Nitratireductor soli]
MRAEILTPEEMGDIDRRAAVSGPFDGYRLMRNAGDAVVAETLARFADAAGFDVLCGPGNNGGDGYVVARLLAEHGLDVLLFAGALPREGSDAALAAGDCPLTGAPFDAFQPKPDRVVIDALFGAGLSKPVSGVEAEIIGRVAAAGARVVAIDLPSGVSGASGQVLGAAFDAALTVTFFRRKPGHLLYPGRALCGETVLADIGIADALLRQTGVALWENEPALWQPLFPSAAPEAHKYTRGHVAVFSGGPTATGAARLAARGAARIGAGAVTLLSPAGALMVNAMHLTAIMLRRAETVAEVERFFAERRPAVAVLGPGFGVGDKARAFALCALRQDAAGLRGLVLDADAISAFSTNPQELFDAAREAGAPSLVLTPHEGEFGRLFPGLAGQSGAPKVERARQAAKLAGAIVVLKGADTVIADPDGRAAINTNATSVLAAAGSGDVLAGIIAGLMAQGMPAFEAACAGVWLHAEAGQLFGPGLIAEDLPELLPEVLADLTG